MGQGDARGGEVGLTLATGEKRAQMGAGMMHRTVEPALPKSGGPKGGGPGPADLVLAALTAACLPFFRALILFVQIDPPASSVTRSAGVFMRTARSNRATGEPEG
jgi:hypothetical protein